MSEESLTLQKKRKNRTSSAAVQRYKKKVYKRVVADLDKNLVARWEAQLEKDNLGKSEFIRNAIKNYLNET